jgi:DHA1 family bicyclomycin/chloramphenicol resistance-like MFS transporter
MGIRAAVEGAEPLRSPRLAGLRSRRPGGPSRWAGLSPAPIAILVIVSMVQPTAMNMYVPAMAAMRADLSTSASAIQATLSAFLAATALGQLFVGPVSDLFGRRPVLLAGLVVFLAGTLVCALAPTVDVLIAGRMIQAVGSCAGLTLSRAIIRDVHGPGASASMIGYVTMAMAVAPMVTPALGGLIYEVSSWRMIFAAMGLLGVAALVFAAVRLRETHVPSAGGNVFGRFRREVVELASIRLVWLFTLTLAALSMGFFAFVAGGAFMASTVYGLSASTYGLYFVFAVGGYIIGSFVSGRYGGRVGIARMILAGNAISLAGVAVAAAIVLAGVGHPLGLFGPMVLVGLGNGFALPNAIAGVVSIRPDVAGTASGFAGAFQVGSGAAASVLVGLLIDGGVWDGTPWPILVPMLVSAVAALALAFTLRDAEFR